MRYSKKSASQEKWTIAIKESVASFFFVLLYFLLINPVAKQNAFSEMWVGALIYAAVFFSLVWYYKPSANIHVLPVISFIKALHQNTFKCFWLRVSGQLAGAFGAAFMVFYARVGSSDDNVLIPLDPFLTGLFSGVVAQAIYFLYIFLLHRKDRFLLFRVFLFSIGLGILYFAVHFFHGITLFNPFGLLLDYMLSAQFSNVWGLLTGFIVHALVPILFITGTHYFVKAYFKGRAWSKYFHQ